MKDPITMERLTKSGRVKFTFTLGAGMNREDAREALVILEETLAFMRPMVEELTPKQVVH